MGGIPVTQLVFHHKHHHLPPASEKVLPVQLYGLSGQRRGDISDVWEYSFQLRSWIF